MNTKLLAQAVDFQALINSVFPSEALVAKADLTLGDIISALLPYIFVLAGLLLFGLLLMAGFGLLTSAGDPKKIESAKGKLTNGVIGFVIIFVAYWLVQIMEVIFNLKIF